MDLPKIEDCILMKVTSKRLCVNAMHRTRRGVVLILVLSIIVLLTGIIVAFFSRTLFDRQISNSSASGARVGLFAKGALDVVVGDIKEEIAAGSTASILTSSGTTVTVFLPVENRSTNNQTFIPYRVGTSDSLPNLVKRSAYNQPFYDGMNYDTGSYPPPNRAANIPTTTPALNGRLVSLARWNKPLLLPKANSGSDTDQTPAASFVAPDWILVARSGSNPAQVDSNVVGRYAYAIYDEGGLLDINVAGYPSALSSTNSSYKNALALADLSQLGLSSTQIDSMIAWRNYASLSPSGSFPAYSVSATNAAIYYSTIQANTSGWLRTGNAGLYNGQSDRQFTSRQVFLNLLQSIGSNGTEKASLQKAAQYLGTFSRDINQPSYVPAHFLDASAPTIVAGNGGNNAVGGDGNINPSFLTIRTGASSFNRNDGTPTLPGEPLVKKRFPLSRLAWITYKGPSAQLGAGDAVNAATIKALGWPQAKAEAWIQQGTGSNIEKYFGLTWKSGRWEYTAHLSSSHTINTLAQVAAANREPDFVELLKASITAGSLGKGATRYTAPVLPMSVPSLSGEIQQWEDFQFRQDVRLDAQIIQIAANMIDQFDVDGFPSRIYFDDGTTTGAREYAGVENLPYFYRVRPGIIKARLPVPDATTLTSGSAMPNSPALTDAGVAVCLLQPELWNPFDQNASRGSSGMIPTEFRFLADSTMPHLVDTGTANYAQIFAYSRSNTNPEFQSTDASGGPSFFNSYKKFYTYLTGANSELDFEVPVAQPSLFREPTFLFRPNVPSGSNLRMSGSNVIRQIFADSTLSNTLNGAASDTYVGIKSVQDGATYLGIYCGVGPLRWVTSSATVVSALKPASPAFLASPDYDRAVTFRVQCKVDGTWVTYDQKVTAAVASQTVHWPSTDSYGLIGADRWFSCIDPRTSRFGMGGGNAKTLQAPGSATMSSPSALNIGDGVVFSNRWDAGKGVGMYDSNPTPSEWYMVGLPVVDGWYPNPGGNWNDVSNQLYLGLFAQNSTDDDISSPNYFADADGVVRRGMGAYISGSTGVISITGQPQATATSYPAGTVTAQSQSRPIMLNRPFKSVAELGYVFSGTPWRNLDMYTPESGCAGLLDAFCINDTEEPSGLMAGKVNLNTRQSLVLQAILAGAYKDELTLTSGTLVSGEASAIASALVQRTSSTATGKGPLRNVSELVGKWVSAEHAAGTLIDGRKSYSGFSDDLSSTDPVSNNIERMREASMRALVNSGNVRVWNLLIDLVAQTGRYSPNATGLDKFVVDGEQRCWLHVAIDRYTGEVVDQILEVVNE